MDLKTIFAEGKKEWKRRRSISQDNSTLKNQQTQLTSRLSQLGQKAWEEKIDISHFPTIQAPLTQNQNQADELKELLETCQKNRQDQETLKGRENDRYSQEKAAVDEEKKGVDERLNHEKNQLKTLQKDISQAESRTNQIARERENLQKKITDPNTPAADRSNHENRLLELSTEEAGLLEKRRLLNETVVIQNNKIAPLQTESETLQKKITDILNRQKEAIGTIDKALTDIRKETESHNTKIKEIEKQQQQQFTLLGEQLAKAGSAEAAICTEMSAVRETEEAIKRVNQNIADLGSQQNDTASKAYKQMLTIIIGGSLLIIALIVTAVILLKPKPKNVFEDMLQGKVPVEALGEIISKTLTDKPEDLKKGIEEFQKGMGALKAASEEKIGDDTPVASEADLKSVFTSVSGWEATPPIYNKINISGIESSSLRNTYTKGEDQEIQVEVTDTHSASILLAPAKSLLMMNMAVDDEQMFQKTGKLEKYPMIESLEKDSQTARLIVLIEERYLINLETQVENGLETLKEFAAQLNLSSLD